MDTALTARVPKKFTEFLIDYTYPPISIVNSTELQASLDDQSCVAQAIADKANSIGQDVLDDVLGLGDAIAGAFHKQMCKQFEEVREEQLALGQDYRPVEELQKRAEDRKEERKKRKGDRETEKTRREGLSPEEREKERKKNRETKKDKRKDARKVIGAAAAEQAF